jgi:SAM-dependent methyltransferase
LHCAACSRSYADTAFGQLDLRPRGPKSISITLALADEGALPGDEWPPLGPKAEPEVAFSPNDIPFHLSSELLSWFPRASGPEALALDLGCGTAPHRGVCERAGYTHVGVDYEGDAAAVLADAHCLPFEDQSFDFVLSIAVLEHVRYPFVFMREVARVLRPGGTFIGTVAFLEPFHARSYYHHTHLGLIHCLVHAPLECVALGPVRSWPALRALGEMALFPPLPPPLTRILVSPLQAMHRLWWGVAGLVRPRATDARRRTWTAGAFEFVARKARGSEGADSTR